MTRQQAIQMLNALANRSTPQQEHHRIVLSCSTKGRLLYQDSNEEDHTSNFVLYDGKETYSFTLSSQQNILMNFYVEPNFAFWRMDFFPLAGLNLPYVSLLKSLEIQTNAQGHMPQAKVKAVLMRARMPENIVPYHNAVMEAEVIGNILRPRKITLFFGANTPLDEWDYRDYTSFKNCWLSSAFYWRRWSSLAPSQVDTIANFRLVRASPTALSDQQFNPKTWLPHLPPNSGRIIYLIDYRSNPPIQVSYANLPGSIDEIIAKAKRNVSQGTHHVPLGFLIITAGLLILGITLLWRQFRQPCQAKV